VITYRLHWPKPLPDPQALLQDLHFLLQVLQLPDEPFQLPVSEVEPRNLPEQLVVLLGARIVVGFIQLDRRRHAHPLGRAGPGRDQLPEPSVQQGRELLQVLPRDPGPDRQALEIQGPEPVHQIPAPAGAVDHLAFHLELVAVAIDREVLPGRELLHELGELRRQSPAAFAPASIDRFGLHEKAELVHQAGPGMPALAAVLEGQPAILHARTTFPRTGVERSGTETAPGSGRVAGRDFERGCASR